MMPTTTAAAASLERLLNGSHRAGVVFRAELALLAAFSLALIPLSLDRGGRSLWLVPAACAVQVATAVCWARIRRGERRHALVHAVAALGVVLLLLVALGPRLAHYRTLTVLSGSMAPTFDPGDMIVVSAETANDLRVGQIITYQTPVGDRHVVSHRVVRIVSEGLRPVVITKGDGNATPDPWEARLAEGPLWRYRFRVPLLGYLIAWLRQPLLRTISVLIIPGALAMLAIVQLWEVKLPWLRPARSGNART